jgi:hypothetical protein
MYGLRRYERRFQFALVRKIEKQYKSPVGRVSRLARPSDKSDNDLFPHRLRGQFQTLLDKLRAKETHTGDIAAGPVEACNKVKLDGIAGYAEYDGE